jgi:hypothetical protein
VRDSGREGEGQAARYDSKRLKSNRKVWNGEQRSTTKEVEKRTNGNLDEPIHSKAISTPSPGSDVCYVEQQSFVV